VARWQADGPDARWPDAQGGSPTGSQGHSTLGWKLSLCVGGAGEIAGRTLETTVHAGRREADVVIA
jgi:hypothetical protein